LGYWGFQKYALHTENLARDFSFKKTDKITHITLSDEKGKHVSLDKDKDGNWIFEKKYTVGDEAIHLLLDALKRMETLGPVPQAGIENVVRDLLNNTFKIEIFTGGDKPAKAFYVGGPTLDNQGTYMLMEIDGEPAQIPFITYIPGQRAYLTARFDVDTLHWRSPWIFPYAVNEISEFSLIYSSENEKSFTITRSAPDSFSIADYQGDKTLQPKQTYIQQYLSFCNTISLEAYQNELPTKDSILLQTPYATAQLKTTDGKTQTAILYRNPINNASRILFDEQGKPLLYDVEFYYLQFNNKEDFAVVQYFVWSKLLRSYKEFFAKPLSKK
jgi:hypothetical protein